MLNCKCYGHRELRNAIGGLFRHHDAAALTHGAMVCLTTCPKRSIQLKSRMLRVPPASAVTLMARNRPLSAPTSSRNCCPTRGRLQTQAPERLEARFPLVGSDSEH